MRSIRSFENQLFQIAAILFFSVLVSLAANAADLRIGMLADEFGINADLGKDYIAGARTYFDHTNAHGGVNGKKLSLIVKDDGGDPANTVRLTRQFIEKDKVDLLFGYIGDEGVRAISKDPVFKAAGIALYAPLSGAEIGDEHDNIFFVRPSYRDEAKHVIQHFTLLGNTNFVTVATPGELGTTLTAEVSGQLKARGLRLAGKFGLATDLKGIDAVARNVLNAKAQVVVVAADTIATAEFLKRFRALDTGTSVVAFSIVNHRTLIELAKPEFASGTMLTQVVPHPLASDTKVQSEHRALMAKYRDEPPSHLTLEGFLAAKGLVKALERAGREPSRAAIVAALSGDKRFDLGGIALVFSPTNDRGSNFVDIAYLRKTGRLVQ
jgi:ABC-type branched-subunit amino acid transport system substrate-binding protein